MREYESIGDRCNPEGAVQFECGKAYRSNMGSINEVGVPELKRSLDREGPILELAFTQKNPPEPLNGG